MSIHLSAHGKPSTPPFADNEVSQEILQAIIKHREAKKTCDGAENHFLAITASRECPPGLVWQQAGNSPELIEMRRVPTVISNMAPVVPDDG